MGRPLPSCVRSGRHAKYPTLDLSDRVIGRIARATVPEDDVQHAEHARCWRDQRAECVGDGWGTAFRRDTYRPCVLQDVPAPHRGRSLAQRPRGRTGSHRQAHAPARVSLRPGAPPEPLLAQVTEPGGSPTSQVPDQRLVIGSTWRPLRLSDRNVDSTREPCTAAGRRVGGDRRIGRVRVSAKPSL